MHLLIAALKALIGLCLFVPLIIIPGHFYYPAVVPKVIVFRAVIEIMTVLWLWLGVV